MQKKEVTVLTALGGETDTWTEAGKKSVQQNREQIVHGEDLAHKFAMQFFGTELLQYLGIRVKVARIVPTELVHLEVKHMYEDFNFEMEDGNLYHLEFESDGIGTDDLRRFRAYEAITSQNHKVPVITCVLCSSAVEQPMSSLTEGINTYHVRIMRLKDRSADEIFDNLKKKPREELEKEDLVPVVFTPLMGGEMALLERARFGVGVLSGEYPKVTKEDLRRMLAALMVLAGKVLDPEEMERVKETCGMSDFFRMLVEDGIQQGIQQGGTAMLRLVVCMQKNEEDAPKIQYLETDLELRRRMMEKYKIVI